MADSNAQISCLRNLLTVLDKSTIHGRGWMVFYDSLISYFSRKRTEPRFLTTTVLCGFLLFFGATLLPGALALYIFDRSITQAGGTVFFVLSMSFTFPVYLLNFVLWTFTTKRFELAEQISICSVLSGIVTMDVLYFSLIVGYLFNRSLLAFAITLILSEIAYITYGTVSCTRKKRADLRDPHGTM